MTPPLLSITGKKNSGKTTLVVRLGAELTRRGLRVMTIKHGSHTFNMDPVNTDTYRHYHEGKAEKVAMISPDKFALVERWDQPLTPHEIAARFMADADLVLCEGFKVTDLHAEPLYDPALPNAASWRAMVSDDRVERLPFPLFMLDHDGWLNALATWVEHTFLTGGR